jgi:HlyD family secretion protein
MDIVRKDVSKKKRIRKIAAITVTVVAVVAVTFGISLLEPAAPNVDRNAVWIDEVKRGQMIRQVRGIGSLVPEDIRFITAETRGLVEQVYVLPGAIVDESTIILEISNPELEQQELNARLALEASEAQLLRLKVELEANLLQRRSELARIESEFKLARLTAEVNQDLFDEGLLSERDLKTSQIRAETLATQFELEKQRLDFGERSLAPQLKAQEADVNQARTRLELFENQVRNLKIRPTSRGVLQRMEIEVGQQISQGQSLAQVANPRSLKAVVRIPETQARDVQIGQMARVDTRNGVIDGEVMRVDPNVENGTVEVDIRLVGDLPKGARPDLTVEGTVELENLPDVLFVGRPAFGRANSTVGVFKMEPGSNIAIRAPVQFGRISSTTIEVVQGLEPGDRIILSDTAQWDQYDRIQIN